MVHFSICIVVILVLLRSKSNRTCKTQIYVVRCLPIRRRLGVLYASWSPFLSPLSFSCKEFWTKANAGADLYLIPYHDMRRHHHPLLYVPFHTWRRLWSFTKLRCNLCMLTIFSKEDAIYRWVTNTLSNSTKRWRNYHWPKWLVRWIKWEFLTYRFILPF